MELGVYITGQGKAWNYDNMRRAFREAEELGFDAGWTMDNTVGALETAREEPVLDAWTILPALAEATERIRLGPLVTPVNRRPFAVVAKSTSVFDHVSHGRLNLGLGAGDHAEYWEPWGMEYPAGKVRVDQLREQIQVLRLMWTEDLVDFDGEYVSLRGAINFPKPLQKPHPPIWIGLTRSRRLMPELAAQHADGINIYLPEEDLREMLEIFKRSCDSIGRDPDSVLKSRNVICAVTDREIDLPEVIRAESELGIGEFDAMLHNITDYENPVIGNAEHCVERISELGEGFDQVIVKFTGLDSENKLYTTTVEGESDAMARFGHEVLPSLKGQQ